MSAFSQPGFYKATVGETPNHIQAAKQHADHQRLTQAASRARQSQIMGAAGEGGKYLYDKTGVNPMEAGQYFGNKMGMDVAMPAAQSAVAAPAAPAAGAALPELASSAPGLAQAAGNFGAASQVASNLGTAGSMIGTGAALTGTGAAAGAGAAVAPAAAATTATGVAGGATPALAAAGPYGWAALAALAAYGLLSG